MVAQKKELNLPHRTKKTTTKYNTIMKHLFLTLLACLAIASCSAFDDDYFAEHQSKTPELVANKFQVHQKSAEYFAHKVSFDDNVTRSVSSVEPLAHGKDTLLYIVNFSNNNGWIVLSGDKRTVSILASSKTGQFDLNHLGGSAVWMQEVAEKIYGVKRSNHQDTTSTAYKNWCCIDTLALNIKKGHPTVFNTRSALSDKNHYKRQYPDSITELVNIETKIITTKQVGPLIQTKWGQSDPWNKCVPALAYADKNCYTGCVAVAGAQMLYYFHYLKNKPEWTYSQGGHVGVVWDDNNKSYSYSFSNPSPIIWDKMSKSRYQSSKEGTDAVSVLMSYVGTRVNMDYRKEGSGTKTENLINLYRENGISAEMCPYDFNLVIKSLDKKLPVNIRAATGIKEYKFLFIPLGKEELNGHSWIIDGYKETEIETTYNYKRYPSSMLAKEYEEPEESDGPAQIIPAETERFFKKTTSGILMCLLMNWGYDGTYDDAEYTVLESGPWNANGLTYNTSKKIIHNFKF